MSNSEQINNQKMNRGSVDEERLIPHSTETKRELYKYIRIGITAFVTFVCCILFFFIILRYKGFADTWKKIISTAQPIIIGLILAYLLNPVMKFFESHLLKFLKPHMKSERKAKKTARALGVTGAILFLLVIIGLLIAAIVPSVINSIISLADTLPGNVQSFISWIDGQSFGDTEVTNMIGDCMTKATDFVENWFRNTFLPQANTFITEITSGVISFVKGILNFIIGIIVAVYVMMIKETLTGQSKKIIYSVCNPKTGNIIIEMVRKSNEIFGGFVTGKILDSAIIGVICYIGCLILKMPDSILIAVIVGCTNVIPFFGPFIGAIPALLLVVIQSPIHALYLLIFIIVLQQVDGNIIGPKILGDSTGLSSFWVMFAILIAGGMWGFAGMVLGVPVFAVIYYIIRRLVAYALKKKQLPTETTKYVHMTHVDEKHNSLQYNMRQSEPVKSDESDVEFGEAPGEENKKNP